MVIADTQIPMEQVEEHSSLTFHRKQVTNSFSSSLISNHNTNSTKKTSTKQSRISVNGFFKGSPPDEEKSDEEKLKERGISIVESNVRNFANISPEEVTDYYKGLGEWQDVLPKTDYAYSPLSVYNKKKINGIYPVIPNMSRRSLWSNHYESCEVKDNELNSFYAKQYPLVNSSSSTSSCSSSRKRWLVRRDLSEEFSKKGYLETTSYSSNYSSSTNLRQWISTKRSSVVQFSAELYRRWYSFFKKIRTRSASLSASSTFSSASSSSRSWFKILVQHVFPFLLFLFLILYLFLWSPLSTPSLSPVVDNLYECSVIVLTTLSRFIQSLFSLVYNFIDSSLASGTFILSCISWPREFPNVVFAPLYEEFWSIVTPPPTPTEERRSRLDDSQLEELFRRLFDARSSEFTRKVTSSQEFNDMIEQKLREFEEQQKRAYEKLVDENTSFEERFRTLEKLVAESNVSERIVELREEVLRLKEEVRTKETKVENDFYVLLSAVLQTEPNGEKVNADELKAKFVSIFRSIEEAHFKIDKLNREFLNYANNASERVEMVIERSRERVKRDLRSTVEELTLSKLDEWKRTTSSETQTTKTRLVDLQGDVEVLESYVKKIVRQALDVYDADKTGMADYALESSGGIVLSTRCTETKKSHAQFSILGIPFWQTSTSPRTVIQPAVHPGECWAFPGSTGYLVIQLSQSIYITSVTLEHIPKAIAANGTIDSAPKDFSVWALRSETDQEAKFLGKFRYDDNGPSVQTYDVVPLDQPYQIVELKILSNHGRIDYTCLYRFRVHGIPV